MHSLHLPKGKHWTGIAKEWQIVVSYPCQCVFHSPLTAGDPKPMRPSRWWEGLGGSFWSFHWVGGGALVYCGPLWRAPDLLGEMLMSTTVLLCLGPLAKLFVKVLNLSLKLGFWHLKKEPPFVFSYSHMVLKFWCLGQECTQCIIKFCHINNLISKSSIYCSNLINCMRD